MNPADKIERRAIEELIPYARNSRTHSDAQVAQIAASIKEWGWTMPILVDEAGGIIAGHGRVMAARSLGHKDVPVVIASGWSETKKRAYVIADNKLALNAGWDQELLKVEIADLESMGSDLSLLGFDSNELASLFDEKEEELKEETYAEVFNVIVECVDEQEQEKVFNKLDTEGYKCRVQSL
jgi:ParB-like chromosome segregation protein Spo0J